MANSVAASFPLSLLAILACGVSRPWEITAVPAPGLPEHFVPDTSVSAQAAPVAGCRGRLMDPRDGTQLTLVRSTAHGSDDYWGDYGVMPPERYGLGPDALLRVDCRTGYPLGAVPRGA
jgi:hypothetical protein